MPAEPMNAEGGDWRVVADDLAFVLRTAILRNPNLTALDWDRAHAALERYERAGGEMPKMTELREATTE
jgi:hypothetical protein